MKTLKKSAFTLIELLIVIFIISFGVLLTGVKVKEMYQEQRFLSEAQQVLSQLAMAQDLMLIMDADVQVKIAPDPAESRNLQIWLEVEKPLEEPWARFIERKLTLQAIRSFGFENGSGRQLALHFSLGRMSKGVLALHEGDKNDSRSSDKRLFQIELAGYPRPLKGTTGSEEKNMGRPRIARRQAEKSKSLYPAEVYEKLYEDPNPEKETI